VFLVVVVVVFLVHEDHSFIDSTASVIDARAKDEKILLTRLIKIIHD
jgi:hypothetical protein